MNPSELIKGVRRLPRKIVEPGSPFRYLRKASGYLTRPVDSWNRIAQVSPATRDMTPALRSKVATVKAEGYADALTELDPALLAELDSYCQTKLAENPNLESKLTAYWANLTGPADRTVDGILVRFALQEPVLKLATAYFGQVPYLADVDISASYSTGKSEWVTSQLWHRDYADDKTIKLWVYLSDVVSKDDGPFTYVQPTPSQSVRNTFFPGRVKDETIAECVAPEDVKEVYGRRGSAFYIDTSTCYHCGSRVSPGHRRIAYVATFLTRNSLYPMENGISGPANLSAVQKLVLGL